MTEAKHTPGPWTYTKNPENTRFIIDSEPAHGIACTAGFEPNNEANARIIAAAPDLLYVLKELAALDFGALVMNDDDERRIDFVARKARAAIAKAEGGV